MRSLADASIYASMDSGLLIYITSSRECIMLELAGINLVTRVF